MRRISTHVIHGFDYPKQRSLRIRITINLNRPDEVVLRYKTHLSRANFMAILAHPIEHLMIGINAQYSIQVYEGGILPIGKMANLTITSGDLCLATKVFNGTAILEYTS